MDIRTLKYEADQALCSASYPPRRLVLIHTGIALGVSLVLALISYILDRGVVSGGGLSGMGTQSALMTAQVVLQLASAVAMPFWSAGLIFAMLGYVQQQPVSPQSLTQGFRRFVPILTSGIWKTTQYLGMGFVSVYVSSALVAATPYAAPVYKLMATMEENPDLDLTALDLNADGMMEFMIACGVIFVLVYAALTLPIYYRYRMVNYIIMDQPKAGGFAAMFVSRAMMRGRKLKLLKLDLSFWWFYALELLLSVVAMGDLLLSAVGVTLPVPADVAYWMCQLLAVAGQLGLYYLAKPKIEVTYALCYKAFLQPQEPKPRKPVEHPWTY